MRIFLLMLSGIFIISCKQGKTKAEQTGESGSPMAITSDSLIYPGEKHFKSIRQVTFGGDNAEAYWSFDDTHLIFQSNYEKWGVGCDQMFIMGAEERFEDKQPPMVSTGMGRTTCGYFLPDNKHIVYASTHLKDPACPEVPLRKNGKYVWPVYDSRRTDVDGHHQRGH